MSNLLTGPLPHGTVILEASAGTGKTYAIAALTTRYLAEGVVTASDLLVVTFSRAATAELRSRVRQRLRDSSAALRQYLVTGTVPGDEVDAILCQTDQAEVQLRADRLAQAFASLDQIMIATTHEWCAAMIKGLGILAPQEPASQMVENLHDLVDEVASDVYLHRYGHLGTTPPFPFTPNDQRNRNRHGQEIARDATDTLAELIDVEGHPRTTERVAYARQVRVVLDHRKQMLGLHSFDDQLTRLRDALLDPINGEAAATRLSDRYRVVLIDEFQDTDPMQWQILEAAFASRSTMVLIGDPKQAVYSFRGGDVHTYGVAVQRATTQLSLDTNYRSDAPVVSAINALFNGIMVGDDITVPPVRAHHQGSRLSTAGQPWTTGGAIRVIEGDSMWPSQADRIIQDDLVASIAWLLTNPPQLDLGHTQRRIQASDLAIVVRTNARGERIAEALVNRGIPATFSGTKSVFTSHPAQEWVTLLTALDQRNQSMLNRAVLTDFVGSTVAELTSADETQRTHWATLIHRWARILTRQGIPALWTAIEADTAISARLLGRPDGERLVTDHRHLTELLHRQWAHHRLHIGDLARWLAEQTTTEANGQERTRRLDTDAAAVQVMTIHRAKGLQYPIVFVPDAALKYEFDRAGTDRSLLLSDGGQRFLDVAGAQGQQRMARWQQHTQDETDESLRMLYVALTRAQSYFVTWWAPTYQLKVSPLQRLLQTPRQTVAQRPQARVSEEPPSSALSYYGIAIQQAPVLFPSHWTPPSVESAALHYRHWTRTIDPHWKRTSYSGLTASAHHSPAHSEHAFVTDEPSTEVDVDADPTLNQPSPMALLPGGVDVGTVVHRVYEIVDPSDPHWETQLQQAVQETLQRWPIEGMDVAKLTAALRQTYLTPLGPLAPGATLRSFAAADRRAELDFEFPLNNPDATLAEVADIFAHHVSANDALADYPRRLADPNVAKQRLHGFLTGSIDAVLRRPDGGHVVVDYKTNRLSAPGADPASLTIGHYTPTAMAEAMMASHYPLQALLYSVALHRFLNQRQCDYDPDRHLGGVMYLFVRGMAGPTTPVIDGHPLGVFSWRPSTALVTDISRLLAGEPS